MTRAGNDNPLGTCTAPCNGSKPCNLQCQLHGGVLPGAEDSQSPDTSTELAQAKTQTHAPGLVSFSHEIA